MAGYYIVTGAAGFIGSNLVRALNARGERDIIAVDNLTRGDKFNNLVDCEIADYIDKAEFQQGVADGRFDEATAFIEFGCPVRQSCGSPAAGEGGDGRRHGRGRDELPRGGGRRSKVIPIT